MRLARLIALAAAGFATVPAAQAAPTIQNGYYQELVQIGCNNANGCSVKGTAIPAGKTLIVDNFGCHLSTSANTAIITAYLGAQPVAQPVAQRLSYGVPTYTGIQNGRRTYVHQTEVQQIVKTGEQPLLGVTLNAAAALVTVNCTVSGRLL